MKTDTFKGSVATAYGRTLPEPIKFDGSVELYESVEELRNSKDWPEDKEILSFVNNSRKAAARAKATQDSLTAAGIEKPTLENDVQLQLKTLIKVYRAAGKSDDEAREMAETSLGAKLEE